MRFALGVEYDGSDFSGWETQPARRTVQSSLESALSSVADSPVATICAGRTDAGVHALAQVVHFESGAQREPHEWVLGANSNLPDDVCVRWALPVAEEFHARYSATRRYYRYLIHNRRERSALLRRRAAWERGPLEVAPMQAACEHLLGEQGLELTIPKGEVTLSVPPAARQRVRCVPSRAPRCGARAISCSSTSPPTRFSNTWCATLPAP